MEMIYLASVSSDINMMQTMVNEWTLLITEYVTEFVRKVLPIFIYVITFKVVLSKS